MIFILGHRIDLSIFVTGLCYLRFVLQEFFFMGDNSRFLLNLMRGFDSPVPGHLLYSSWFLVMDYVQELFWKQSVCHWCAGEYSLLSPVGFHYSLDLKKGDPPGLPPDCWDLVVLTLTSVSLKRPNEKKSFERITFQALKPSHYAIIAL